MNGVCHLKKNVLALQRHKDDPDNTTAGLIKAALFGDGTERLALTYLNVCFFIARI